MKKACEDTRAFYIAEGAFAMMHAMMKDISLAMKHVQNDGLGDYPDRRSASLHFTRVCIYGMNDVGRQFLEFIRPYRAEIYAYDPAVKDMPEGVTKVDSLEELFATAQILVIAADLCEETKGSVTAELLAKLIDGAIIVHPGSELIIDMNALVTELESNRLRAALDAALDLSDEAYATIRSRRNVLLMGGLASVDAWGN